QPGKRLQADQQKEQCGWESEKASKALPQSPAAADIHKKPFPGALGYKMEQALVSEYVPVVIHPGRHKPESLSFAFYNPNYTNSYCPFYTLQKPTCGYRYCRDTDHRRKVLDVERVNIPKWRSIVVKKPGVASGGGKQ
uniref:Ciliary microtubule inner protein 3 n=1 Tax=Salvator merianae TaxID=96440 RepID=A0A8D0DKZ3_SALMN